MNLLSDILVGFYLFLMLGVLPYYMTDGYARLGTDKAEFCAVWSLRCGEIFLALLFLRLLISVGRGTSIREVLERAGLRTGRLSATEGASLAYAALLGGSFLGSIDRETALWGEPGWYVGTIPQLLGIAFFWILSRSGGGEAGGGGSRDAAREPRTGRRWRGFGLPPERFALIAFPASFGVFGLGLLGVLGIYPSAWEAADPSKLSTIGNRNWYCGYLVSVSFSAIAFLRPLREARGGVLAVQIALRGYLLTAAASLVTQGSASGYLSLLAAAGVGLFALARGDGGGDAPREPDRKPGRGAVASLSRIVLGLCAAAVLGYGILLVWNTRSGGALLGGDAETPSLLYWNRQWGSLRGAAWEIGWRLFLEQDATHRWLGAGPDCFYRALRAASPQLRMVAAEAFGASRLTNAHSEYLTALVNEGILGAAAFGAMNLTALVRFLRAGLRGNRAALACGLTLAAIAANNLVSFRQTLTLTAFCLALGFGERALAREYDDRVRQMPAPDRDVVRSMPNGGIS